MVLRPIRKILMDHDKAKDDNGPKAEEKCPS